MTVWTGDFLGNHETSLQTMSVTLLGGYQRGCAQESAELSLVRLFDSMVECRRWLLSLYLDGASTVPASSGY